MGGDGYYGYNGAQSPVAKNYNTVYTGNLVVYVPQMDGTVQEVRLIRQGEMVGRSFYGSQVVDTNWVSIGDPNCALERALPSGFNWAANFRGTGHGYGYEENGNNLAKIPFHTMYAKIENSNKIGWCESTTTSDWCYKILTGTQLAQSEMIGKYVSYVPESSHYVVGGEYTGTGSIQIFDAITDMKWRIWGVEGNKLLLISETLPGYVQLKGPNGYNNAVKILNDACSTMFGASSRYGSGAVEARSINQEDIDKVTNMTTDAQRKAAYSNYGTTHSYSERSANWPNIYAQEPGKSGGGSLNRSSQSSWYTGTTESSFTGKYTNYIYNITDYATHPMYDALLTNLHSDSTVGSEDYDNYWVATRCNDVSSDHAGYGTFTVAGGLVQYMWTYASEGTENDAELGFRPIVELNLDFVAVGDRGHGTSANPIYMEGK